MNQKIIASATIIIGIVATTAIGLAMRTTPPSSAGVKNTTLRSSVSAPIETLDSDTYGSLGASDVISATNVGLYARNAKGKVVPAISDGHPQISADHLRYVFTLRPFKWSNGSPVTAADFVYAWRRLASPAVKARNASRIDMIANGYAVRTGSKPLSALGVKALGRSKLQVTLSTANPYVRELLARTTMLPINHNFASKLGNKYGDSSAHTLSDGAFVVQNWTGPKDQRWTYHRNPHFPYQKQVHLKLINFRVITDPKQATQLYRQGKIDYVALDPQQLQNYTGNRNLHYSTSTTAAYLFFNTTSGATANVHLRRAIATAYDKHLLVKGSLGDGAKALNGLVPAGLATSPQGVDYRKDTGQLLPYNPRYANAQWQIARQELHISRIHIPLLIADNDVAQLTATFLKGQIEHNLPGITVDIQKTSLARRITLEEQGKFSVVFSTWTPADGDPYNVLTFNESGNLQNVAGFSDRHYDALLDRITTKYGPQPVARWHAIQQAERLVATQDVPTAGVFQDGTGYLLSSRVKNFPIMPSGNVNYAYASLY
ncbi:peptide ABC transporter substrate-binding protein [Lacticaseibacillus zhaodongensis]|uniref:peptide ABC transporter substrate-binding protein n=1 Tax=Lacticaseibacillus zhaodongensis TaxID=2668065 RepID=UPI0012D2AFC1|nr:peptide ABC transporter substrate-binding protein [Lacticaseibacillus zhaodongensis]